MHNHTNPANPAIFRAPQIAAELYMIRDYEIFRIVKETPTNCGEVYITSDIVVIVEEEFLQVQIIDLQGFRAEYPFRYDLHSVVIDIESALSQEL